MAEIHAPLVNFSRDLRAYAQVAALGLWGGVGLGALAALWLVVSAVEMMSDASASLRIQAKLEVQLAEAKEKAAGSPPPQAFRTLKSRIERLNVLDFAGSVSTVKLLEALEGSLPQKVALTALDYDRARRTVDVVAVSDSSEDLTSLYDVLDKHYLFMNVRLLDKKQSPGVLGSQVQVHLNLQLRDAESAKAAEEAAKFPMPKKAPAGEGAS